MAKTALQSYEWAFNPLTFDRHRCVYCGSPFDVCRDHVIPTSYLRTKRRYEGDWLVPACRECNSTLGDRLIFNVPDRACYILGQVQRTKAKYLNSVVWDEEELTELGHNLRTYVESFQLTKKFYELRTAHLKAVSWQPSSYMAKLRPWIDPEIEDVPEFLDDDYWSKRVRRAEILERAALQPFYLPRFAK